MFTPSPFTRLRCLVARLFTFAACICPLSAQLVAWESALASSAGQSSFTAVEAALDDGTGFPGVLVAGHFTGDLSLGTTPDLTNLSGQDGVVALISPSFPNPWDAVWKIQASSTAGEVTITDMAVDSNGVFYVCGSYIEDITFGAYPLTNSPGVDRGFVAWGDPYAPSPGWQGAFEVSTMQPASIAVGLDGSNGIYVTGPGSYPGPLAQHYDLAGTANWTTPISLPYADTNPTDLAFSDGPGGPTVHLLAEDPSGSASERLVLYQINALDGTENWNKRLGSSGNNYTGGLAATPDGKTALAFCSDNFAITYDSTVLDDIPLLPGTHALLLKVDYSGALLWSTPLGTMSSSNSELLPTDLALDDAENIFVSAQLDGTFNIEELEESGTEDAVILGVDGTGFLFEHQRSKGLSSEHCQALSVPARDLLVMVGHYTGSGSDFGTITLPTTATEQGFISLSTFVDGQKLFILEPTLPLTLPELRQAIHDDDVNGQVYHQIRRQGIPIALTAYLTLDQLDELTENLPLNSFTNEIDPPMSPKGTTSSSGWALGHLNDAAAASAPYSYTYPDTTETVYVYLIDTAVGSDDAMLQTDLDTWFGGNTNLTLEPTTLIRGAGDPMVSSVFEHGTQMASLIAGPETGAGVGVPIVLKNFDFYPNGAVTTSSLLADAVDAATTWHDANTDCAPGIIVIASGSVTSDSSATLTTFIERARDDHNLTVIISAGNESGDTADFTPAENGGEAGIICVAASTESEGVEATSNEGTEVDLYAPGDAVRVVDFSNPTGGGFETLTGTSASAALTCGVAAIHLSLNPWLTPEDLETELTGDTASVGGGPIDVLEVAPTGPDFTGDYDMWAAFYELTADAHAEDDDADGWNNLDEYFYGLDPCGEDLLFDPLAISYDHSAGDYTLAFALNTVLVDPSAPATLLDGSTLEILESTDALSFLGPVGTPSVGSTAESRTEMSYTDSASPPFSLFRIELTPSTPSP